MSDIAMIQTTTDRQPPRALSPRGFGSRERVLKRCRELMVAGTFRPTPKQLETPTLTPKVIGYYFDSIENLYLAALDAPTAIAIARQILRGTAGWIDVDDIARVAHAAVFGRLRT